MKYEARSCSFNMLFVDFIILLHFIAKYGI